MKIDKISQLRKRLKERMNPTQFEIALNVLKGFMEKVDEKIGFPSVHDGITWRPTPLTLHWVVREVKCNKYWFGVNEKTKSMLVCYIHSISDSKKMKKQLIDVRSHLHPYIAADYFSSMFLARYDPSDLKKITFQKRSADFLAGISVALTSDHWRNYNPEAQDSEERSWW